MRRLVLSCLLCWLVSGVARADERTEARRHFKRGMTLIQYGDYPEAIAELRAAYRLVPHPDVLYNIGRAYASAGDPARALGYFRDYLATQPADRQPVEAVIAATEKQLEALQPAAPVEEATAFAVLTDEQREALEQSARLNETLGETLGDDALARRAGQLRSLLGAEPLPPAAPPVETARAPTSLPERGEDVYEERVVSASRVSESPVLAPNSTTVVTAQDIRMSGVTSIGELLRRAGGVDVMTLTGGDTQVSIRGLNQRLSNKVVVLLNGRSVYFDFLGVTVFHMLPITVEDIERIEIIRGPASALYGADAFTGVINIITHEPGRGRSFVSGSVGEQNSARGAFRLSGRSGLLAYRVSGVAERADNYQLSADPARTDTSFNSEQPELGVYNRWIDTDFRADLGRDFVLRVGAGVAFIEQVTFMALGRVREMYGADGVVSQSYAQLQTPSGLGFRLFWHGLYTDAKAAVGAPGAVEQIARDVVQHGVDAEVTFQRAFKLGVPHNLTLGVGYRHKNVQFAWLDDDHKQHHFSLFLQERAELGQVVQLHLGARMDRHPLLGVRVSPRGSLVTRLTHASAARFTVGTAFRSPTFLENYLDNENPTDRRGVVAVSLGDENLSPERMLSFELGYSNQDLEHLSFEANAFVNLVRDQIQLSQIDRFTVSDAPPFDEEVDAFSAGALRFTNERGTFRQQGAELGARVFPVQGLDLYGSYAFVEVQPTQRMDLGGRERDQRTPLHKVNLGLQYRSAVGLEMSTDVHFVSSQVWVEQVSDPETATRLQAFDLDGYVLLNARLGYRLLGDRLELGVVGLNLLTRDGFRQHPFGQRIRRKVLGVLRVQL